MENKVIKLSIIGCDSSHAESFGQLLVDKTSSIYGKSIIKSVWCKNKNFAIKTSLSLNAENYSDLDFTLKDTDGILLLNRFGEERLKLAKKLVKYKIPIFADKPLAMDINEANEFFEIFEKNNVPVMSSSAFRFANDLQKFKKIIFDKDIIGGMFICPAICKDLGDDPRLKNVVFYGIHMAEMINELLGSGFKISQIEKNKSLEYLGIFENNSGVKIRFNFLQQTQDYYFISLYSKEDVFTFKLDLNTNYYEETLKYFIDYICGKNNGINKEDTLESLSLMLQINSK